MVKREDEEDISKGGIIIPDTAKEKPMHAKVVAVGSGIKGEDGSVTPLDVKKVDMVITITGKSPVMLIECKKSNSNLTKKNYMRKMYLGLH